MTRRGAADFLMGSLHPILHFDLTRQVNDVKRILSIRAVLAAAIVLTGLTVTGCESGPTPKPQGKILMNGQPFLVTKGVTFQLVFTGGDGGQKIASQADVHPDGTFIVNGPSNKGLPTGKYRITATCTNPYAEDPQSRGDQFRGVYADPATTPFTVEIAGSKPPPIIIDVGKRTVARGS